MSDHTLRGLPCPMFIREYVLNQQKYRGAAKEIEVHLATCSICRREYHRLEEQIRQWEEDDIPGFRG